MEKNKEKSVGKTLKSLAKMGLLLYFIMSFVISAYRIPTGSMERTLRVGDMLLVNKFIYGIRTPDWIGIPYTEIGFGIPWVRIPFFKDVKQGDVVVFKPPRDPYLYYVKRCVAVPGQTVEIKNKELYVDGKKFTEYYNTLEVDPAFPEGKPRERFFDLRMFPEGAYQDDIFKNLGNRDNFGPITVPEDNYFMMGDNRDQSYDSRYWGFVHKDYIVGKPVMVYFSYEESIPLSRFWDGIRWNRIGYFIQ